MNRRRAVATVCLSGTLEDKLAAAAGAGFDGVEIFENDLIASSCTPEEVRQRCADLGLSVDLYQPFRDFEAVPPERFAANLRRAERKFDLMSRLGAELVLVCSSVSPEAADDDDLAAEQLHGLAEHASRRGIRIAYEALAWGRHVHTWDHSWRIVRQADHPALGLCLDSFHILSRTSDVSGIAEVPGEKIFFVQLADAPRLDMNVLQWSRHHRLFPGQGTFNLPLFLDQLVRAGYSGPLSLEVFNDVFRQADPRRTALDAMRSLLALEEAHDLRFGGHSAALPPAPELAGYAFIRLAGAGPRIAATLTALGFARTGTHRHGPVQLWEQGHARILVNPSAGGADTAEIAALGVHSAHPASSARRAGALLAPTIAGTPGVLAPDGTALIPCGLQLPDFAPTEATPRTWLSGIDHVTLAQPFDAFDEAALFYRSVLGLDPHEDTEYAAPFGLVRSRAMSDPADRVRITLTGTLLRRGEWAPAVPDPQHIAFTTSDIVTAARAMRARGAPLLPIPDNYYDDLDARFALDPPLLAELRAQGVLYDRDEHGEYFHLYTDLVGSRLFFEVVQRVGGYRGSGSANVPVRMAAHRRQRLLRDARQDREVRALPASSRSDC